jgi:hypothetical protein
MVGPLQQLKRIQDLITRKLVGRQSCKKQKRHPLARR